MTLFRYDVPAVAFPIALLGLGLYLCRETFLRIHTAHMNSMHGFWIAIAQLAGGSWWRASWWPYWDGGMPFEFTYAPLIPALAAACAKLLDVPASQGFHIVNGAIFCLGPATLYVFAWRMSSSPVYSFAAAAVYMLTSPSQLVMPDSGFAWRHLWDARRLYVSFVWDETPHMAALALLPMALLALHTTVRTRSGAAFLRACAAITPMLLANAFGATMLALAWPAYALSVQPEHRRRALLVLPLAGVISAVLAAPWLPPSLWLAILRNARAMPESRWTATSWAALAFVAAGFSVLHYLLRRAHASQLLHFASLFAWIVGSIALLYRYLDWHFLPQSGRYLIEWEWAMAIVAVFALRPVLERSPIQLRAMLCFGLLALAYQQVVTQQRFLKVILQEKPIEATVEHQAARWIEQHLPGKRVMLAGSMAQWTNAFSRVQQFRGGSYPTAFNPVQQHASETVMWLSKENFGGGLAWLTAFGVDAVAVPGKHSPEFWKPFESPQVFEQLPLLWRERGTTIYGVQPRSSSLARVVPAALVIRETASGADRIIPFTASLQPAKFEWLDHNRARIRADLPEGWGISIAINYHPGWNARLGSEAISVRPDGLGLIWLESSRLYGPCVVELEYDGGLEAKTMPWLSGASAVLIVFAAFVIRSSSG